MHTYAMSEKTRRQRRVREILERERVTNQQRLQRLLHAEGIEATQATLSRDLRDLGVLKGHDGYTLPAPGAGAPSPQTPELQRALEEFLTGSGQAGNLVVLRTGPGRAQVLGDELDRSRVPHVVGTVAGDDTLFVACPSAAAASQLLRKLRALAGHKADGDGRRRSARQAAPGSWSDA